MGKIRIAKLRWNDGERLPTGLPEFVEYPATLAKKLIDRHFTSPEPKFVTIDRLKEFGISSEPVKTNEQIEDERLEAENKRLEAERKQREFEELKAENERLKLEAANKAEHDRILENQRRQEVEAKKPESENNPSSINLSTGSEAAKATIAKEPKIRKTKESKTK